MSLKICWLIKPHSTLGVWGNTSILWHFDTSTNFQNKPLWDGDNCVTGGSQRSQLNYGLPMGGHGRIQMYFSLDWLMCTSSGPHESHMCCLNPDHVLLGVVSLNNLHTWISTRTHTRAIILTVYTVSIDIAIHGKWWEIEGVPTPACLVLHSKKTPRYCLNYVDLCWRCVCLGFIIVTSLQGAASVGLNLLRGMLLPLFGQGVVLKPILFWAQACILFR